jgi:hypothetical protein
MPARKQRERTPAVRRHSALTKAFLQSLAMESGPDAPTSLGPFARGTVTAIAPLTPRSSLVLATVLWADDETTQVNVVNLEQQPGNPPLPG